MIIRNIIGLFLVCLMGFANAEPYVSKPVVPEDLANSFMGGSINKAVSPDSDQVGVPVYPGAKLINSVIGIKKSER